MTGVAGPRLAPPRHASGLEDSASVSEARGRGVLEAPAAAMLAAGSQDCEPGRTAAEIAASIGRPSELIEHLLADELRRGHLERDGDRYRPTSAFVARFAPAFALVWTEGD